MFNAFTLLQAAEKNSASTGFNTCALDFFPFVLVTIFKGLVGSALILNGKGKKKLQLIYTENGIKRQCCAYYLPAFCCSG